VITILREFWESLTSFLERVGLLVRFALRLLAILPSGLLRVRPIIEQVYNTGAMSLVIIMTCGLFIGMVLGLQGYDLLTRFGSEEYLGTATAISLLRELGPVVTALLFAGRAGTALAAELGLMRATDQIAAMEIMARFLGGVIAMPLLVSIFIVVALFGAQLVGVEFFGVDAGSYWSQMRSAVELDDVREGLTKGLVFGTACSLIAVYEGYNARPTAEGVGRATTRTVVISAVVTLILDYILTALML
jgi:phospholipid/cholesterol/gamma-HCH transport system permease protein